MKLTKILSLLLAMGTLTTHAHSDEKDSKKADTAKNTEVSEGVSDFQNQDEYKFDTRFDVKIEEFDKSGKLKNANEMTMLVKDGTQNLAVLIEQEGINTEMVFDVENENIITLMNTGGQKMATTTSLKRGQLEQKMTDNMDADNDDMGEMPKFTKTGATKTISGYSCDEYKVENIDEKDGSTMTYWLTDEAEIDWVRSMSNMSGLNKQMADVSFETGYPEDGSIIQMVVTEKNGNYTTLTVTDIEQDQDITISTKGYTFMNMGNMGGR